jgi:hypothetical protein
MRRFLALLFLTIFSFQVLPLKAIGKLMDREQTTEEVQQDDANTDDQGGKVVKFQDDQNIDAPETYDTAAYIYCFNIKINALMHLADTLPIVPIAEIPSPPPDFF